MPSASVIKTQSHNQCQKLILNKIITALSLTFLIFYGVNSNASSLNIKSKNKNHRELASSPLSQGEQMLHSMMVTKPKFLENKAQNPIKAKVSGVCKNNIGTVYNGAAGALSSDGLNGYGDCMDGSSRTGRSVSEIMGPAQRQAGFGILLGQ